MAKFLSPDSYTHLCDKCRAKLAELTTAFQYIETDNIEYPCDFMYDTRQFCGYKGMECKHENPLQSYRVELVELSYNDYFSQPDFTVVSVIEELGGFNDEEYPGEKWESAQKLAIEKADSMFGNDYNNSWGWLQMNYGVLADYNNLLCLKHGDKVKGIRILTLDNLPTR